MGLESYKQYKMVIGVFIMKAITVNNREFKIIKLLGKGKGGYSYLVDNDNKKFVVKQIHHEPCDYYKFGYEILVKNTRINRV